MYDHPEETDHTHLSHDLILPEWLTGTPSVNR